MCRLRAYAKYSRESVLGTGKSCQVATRSVTSREKPVSAVQKATQWIRCPFVTTFHLAPRPRITLGGHKSTLSHLCALCKARWPLPCGTRTCLKPSATCRGRENPQQ